MLILFYLYVVLHMGPGNLCNNVLSKKAGLYFTFSRCARNHTLEDMSVVGFLFCHTFLDLPTYPFSNKCENSTTHVDFRLQKWFVTSHSHSSKSKASLDPQLEARMQL